MGMPCGEASSYQVQLASVRLFDSIGVVTTQTRFWSGRPFVKSIASQGEAVLTLIAVRRAGEWRALEARIIDYQLPPSVWAWPDTTLLIGPRYRTNPLTAMRTCAVRVRLGRLSPHYDPRSLSPAYCSASR
jgi:hypothetical protein